MTLAVAPPVMAERNLCVCCTPRYLVPHPPSRVFAPLGLPMAESIQICVGKLLVNIIEDMMSQALSCGMVQIFLGIEGMGHQE